MANCPVCDSEALVSFTIGNDNLQKCPSCHGLWFPEEELGDIEELPDTNLMSDFQDQLDNASIVDNEETTKNRRCPECKKTMDSYQYDGLSGIWINHCSEGHGVWLDKGEVLKIHHHLQDAITKMPKEKLEALKNQMKEIEADENRKEEEAEMSIFSDHKGSKIPLPLWHLMDGVTRTAYHSLAKLGV